MTTLSKVSLGWKHLTQILNDIIGAVNDNKPKAGKGIYVNEAGEISLIEKADAGTAAPTADATTAAATGTSGGVSSPVSKGPTEGAWLNVDVMDGACNRSTITVWAKVS